MPDYRQSLLARVLLSAVLIAVGICACVASLAIYLPARLEYFLVALWLLGGAMIGAGLLMPFRLAAAGVFIGVLVQLSIIFGLARFD
jgi:hypothetical protein